MSNMSYCRFRNTLQDLRDCKEAMSDMTENDTMDTLSPEEYAAMKALVRMAEEIKEEFGEQF